MKNLTSLLAVCLMLCAYSSVEYHNGKRGVYLGNIEAVEILPLQAEVEVENTVISGVAECERWFWFLTKKPAKQTYGVSLQIPNGNFSPNACTRGALYDALSKNNAQYIFAPRYTAVKKGNWCILGLCLHQVNQIIVTGQKANIKHVRQTQEDILELRRKSPYIKDTSAVIHIQ